MRLRGAGGNNPDHLFPIHLEPCVNYEKNRSRYSGAKSDPTFFLIRGIVTLAQGVGILEDEESGLEPNIGLQQV